MIDRAGLADFLRRRRESLQPEDVGLPRGQRRRTDGSAARGGRRAVPHVDRLLLPARAGARPAPVGADGRLDRAGTAPLPRRARPPVPARRAPPARRAAPTQRARQPGHAAHPRPPGRHPRGDRHRARRDAAADPARRRAHRRPDPATPARHAASATAGSPTPPPARLYAPEDHAFLSRHVRLGAARGRHAARARLPGGAPRRPAARPERGVPRRCGSDHEVGIRPQRASSASSTPRSARSSCTARRCSTRSSPTACSSTPPSRAARATRSCSCSPSSGRRCRRS